MASWSLTKSMMLVERSVKGSLASSKGFEKSEDLLIAPRTFVVTWKIP
jgi:hypothetical protein